MAKGTEAKDYIAHKMIEAFPGSFFNNKEIRIPYRENGELIQIKVVLTAAKDLIDSPYSEEEFETAENNNFIAALEERPKHDPSDAELARLRDACEKLGLI